MVKQSMDLLELLRKRGMDGDVDFLREALRVLVDGIMDAEVSAQIGAREPALIPYLLPQLGTGDAPVAEHDDGHFLTANAAQSGSPTATATATAPGIPASAPWRCTFPSCGRAATSPACWNHGGAASRLCCR